MTTSRLDRAFEWFLDHDGDIYGDEQERLRWYEAIAVTASVQWILVPWVIAILVWTGGRPVATPLLLVSLSVYLPMLIADVYVRRRRVRVVPQRWSRKRLTITGMSLVPYVGIVFGLERAYTGSADPSVLVIGLAGGLIGVAASWWLIKRRQRAEELVDEDGE